MVVAMNKRKFNGLDQNTAKNKKARNIPEDKENENTSKDKNKFNMNYYTNMSNEQFEKFCERLLTLHKTGVYVPPPSKPRICNNKKRERKGPREYIPEEKKRSTMFGKGRVGVSCETFGVKNCACCQPENESRARVLNDILNSQNMVNKSEMIEMEIQKIIAEYSCQKKLNAENPNENASTLEKSSSNLNNFEAFIDDEPIFVNSSLELEQNYCLNNTIIIDDDFVPSTSFAPNNNSDIQIIDDITLSDSDNNEANSSVIIVESPKIKNTYLKGKSNVRDLEKESKMLLRKLMDIDQKSSLNKSFQKEADSDKSVIIVDKIDNNCNNSKTEKKNVTPICDNIAKVTTENTSTKTTGLRLSHCPVCLESLETTEIMSTICGHIFCSPCIQNCIRNTKSCPNCRKKLTLKSIHPIYF